MAADLPFAALPDERILEFTPLSPGYEDHANDVWRVTTTGRTVVVRAPRPDLGAPANPFWAGAQALFGLDPRDLSPIPHLHAHLHHDLGIPTPSVLTSGVAGDRPWLVMEHIRGETMPDLTASPDALLVQLGSWLARLHDDPSPAWGNLTGTQREPLATFPRRLAETITTLTHTFHRDDPGHIEAANRLIEIAAAMPAPARAAPIMLDIDPSQFLRDGERLVGMIDTDAVVLGPPELELALLEPLLDARGATAFRAGYGPLPDLRSVRLVYRLLGSLMEVQGHIPLATWMNAPRWLDIQEERSSA